MNKKNFETVLEQYMGRLAGLEAADDSDQVYKWRAVGCFKRFWNLNAADFAGMFEKAMQEAGNLLEVLQKRGYNQEQLDAIAYKNFYRVFQTVWK